MSAPVYATLADLGTYLAPATVPGTVTERSLRDASAQVDEILLTAIYPVNAGGAPTTPAHIEALMHATCAQAMHVDEYGDQTTILGDRAPVSLGPLSLGAASGAAGAAAAVPVWSSKAVSFLRAEGLIIGPVQT